MSKLISWLSFSNNQTYVRALDPNTGKQKGVFGNKLDSIIQLPAGTYKLRFNNFEINDFVILTGQKLEMKLR